MLAPVDVRCGEPAGEGAVAVLDPLALRARRVRALFLCGLQEGAFPAPVRPRALLGRGGARSPGRGFGRPPGGRPEGIDAERYLLYAAVSRPTELLTLSWHTAGEDGRAAVPSLFIEDICDLFDHTLRERTVRRAPPTRAIDASPSAFLRRPARISDGELLAQVRERAWSASSLKTWIECPVKWFVEKLLRGEDLEPTAEPLLRGGLAHAVLEDTFAGLRERTGSAFLTGTKLALARELAEQSLATREAGHSLSAEPERRPGMRRRLQADVLRYLEHAAACGDEAVAEGRALAPFEPTHLELGFGFEDEEGAQASLPALELSGGVRVRGRVDRIDVGAAGEAVVYDYKSGRAPIPKQWVAQGDLQIALYMRVAEQLLGYRAVGGFYQSLSQADLRPRGVLERDAAPELKCVQGDRRDGEAVEELIEEVLAKALTAAREAGEGALEPRARTCGYGGSGCRYPMICRWER